MFHRFRDLTWRDIIFASFHFCFDWNVHHYCSFLSGHFFYREKAELFPVDVRFRQEYSTARYHCRDLCFGIPVQSNCPLRFYCSFPRFGKIRRQHPQPFAICVSDVHGIKHRPQKLCQFHPYLYHNHQHCVKNTAAPKICDYESSFLQFRYQLIFQRIPIRFREDFIQYAVINHAPSPPPVPCPAPDPSDMFFGYPAF